MSARTIHHRQRRGAAQFGAPWGRPVKWITGMSLLILVTVTGGLQPAWSGNPTPVWVRVLVPLLLLTIFGVIALFGVRGFTVKGRELWIQRPLWQTRVPLHGLQRAQINPAAMRGSLKIAGNGGFLAFTGWFRSKKLGNYRAFVTDPARCVVLEFADRKIVVSPHDPEGFMRALGWETPPNRSSR